VKIRNGFVSNSSSSSFVVAFPKKPKSFDDVYDMMFEGKEGGISVYDHDGMSHRQIAMRVWDDIKAGSTSEDEMLGYGRGIPAKKKDIVEEFATRYHYYRANGCVSCWGVRRDELGGQWSDGEMTAYHGSDKETLIQLRDFVIKTEEEEEAMRMRQHKILQAEFKLECPPYAYKGSKKKDGTPYTKEEIRAYDNYHKALDKFRKEHKEYSEIEAKLRGGWEKKYKKQESLRKKIATADATNFINDHKGHFIVILSYADDGGECTLEHGDIFRNLPHVRISHH